MITASSDKSCRLWDTDSGACLQTMEGHTDEIFSCAFNYEVRFLPFHPSRRGGRWQIDTRRFFSVGGGGRPSSVLRTAPAVSVAVTRHPPPKEREERGGQAEAGRAMWCC